jgi:5'-phosphate synthase pdxT subunit
VSKQSVGILALQGDYALHANSLRKLHIEPVLIRMPDDLRTLNGLIMPGGESTTLLKLAEPIGMLAALKDFANQGKYIFGTCAGAILLADRVINPEQESLGLIHMTIERNGYGRQLDSLETTGQTKRPFGNKMMPMTFIRAPKITQLANTVNVLATYINDPVLVEEGTILAATYHPELTDNLEIYRYWLNKLFDNTQNP